MTRRAKTVLVTVAILAVLMVAGNVAFVRQDDQRAAAFKFAVNQPEAALKQITQIAESKGTLSSSGVGVMIPDREIANLGLTRWTVSPDGTIRGTAPERGLAVLLTPEMRDRKVAWNCKVEPEREFMRGTCGFIGQANR